MGRWVELMFRETGTTIDADTAIATDYTPTQDARLVGTFVIVGGVAATSLIENGYIKMTSKGWEGREHVTPFQGVGLETVPRADKKPLIVPCDLPLKAAIPVKGYYYHNVLPVTPELTVFGILEG